MSEISLSESVEVARSPLEATTTSLESTEIKNENLDRMVSDEDEYSEQDYAGSQCCKSCQDYIEDEVEAFEAKVLEATGYDHKLATRLIPQLYSQLLHDGSVSSEPCQIHIANCAGNAGESNARGSFTANDSGNHGSRKRTQQASQNTCGDEQDHDDEHDDEPDSKRQRSGNKSTKVESGARLACPFNKARPLTYHGMGELKYRSCASPGFRGIKELKYLITILQAMDCPTDLL